MSIYVIFIVGVSIAAILLKYFIEGLYVKRKNDSKEQICIKFLKSLKE